MLRDLADSSLLRHGSGPNEKEPRNEDGEVRRDWLRGHPGVNMTPYVYSEKFRPDGSKSARLGLLLMETVDLTLMHFA
jgi:hypothetical protein